MSRNHRILLAVIVLLVGLLAAMLLAPRLSHAPQVSVDESSVYEPSPEVIAFMAVLEAELVKEYGPDVKGYEPEKLLHVFSNITGEDFAGVEAIIGHYEYSNGTTTYSNTEVTDASADDISPLGYEMLKNNIYKRLQIDTATDVAVVLEKLKGEEDVPVKNTVACPLDAKVCLDGTTVGREGEDCEFSACPAESNKVVTCVPEQRNLNACIELYAPVCGAVQVQCVTTPCNPIEQTFSNSCFACTDENVISYTEGECTTALQ